MGHLLERLRYILQVFLVKVGCKQMYKYLWDELLILGVEKYVFEVLRPFFYYLLIQNAVISRVKEPRLKASALVHLEQRCKPCVACLGYYGISKP